MHFPAEHGFHSTGGAIIADHPPERTQISTVSEAGSGVDESPSAPCHAICCESSASEPKLDDPRFELHAEVKLLEIRSAVREEG